VISEKKHSLLIKKRAEKTAVKSEEDSARIQALESKIETLEAALQSALNKNV
jgi:hypothetical protein